VLSDVSTTQRVMQACLFTVYKKSVVPAPPQPHTDCSLIIFLARTIWNPLSGLLLIFVPSKRSYMDFSVPGDIEGLIFDLDGTLADTMPLHMEAWRQACRHFGMDMSSEFLRSFTGTPGKNIARAIVKYYGREDLLDPDRIAVKKKDNFRNMQYLVKEVKPVADLVRTYHGKLPIALGTGGHRETVMDTLEVIGMSG